jgi:hypothetical protein
MNCKFLWRYLTQLPTYWPSNKWNNWEHKQTYSSVSNINVAKPIKNVNFSIHMKLASWNSNTSWDQSWYVARYTNEINNF